MCVCVCVWCEMASNSLVELAGAKEGERFSFRERGLVYDTEGEGRRPRPVRYSVYALSRSLARAHALSLARARALSLSSLARSRSL